MALPSYGDERQLGWCALCGGSVETADHVPPKIFLEPPYPRDLATVPACLECNGGAGRDEEYVACLIECAIKGSTSPEHLRPAVGAALRHSPLLKERIESARLGRSFRFETERVERVMLKLARGHSLFDFNDPRPEETPTAHYQPLITMTFGQRASFEKPPRSDIWPEVGCRASLRVFEDSPGVTSWIVVQEGNYRYLTAMPGGSATIRMVIGEYLAAEVVWT